MNKFTPGPWRVKMPADVMVGSRRICQVNAGAPDLGISQQVDRACANARLIAAAPDLLEALEMIVSEADSYTERTGKPVYNWLDTARAAIARARGEA